ncbi:hypothetical protein [Pseudalkalibacillus hwajinpoensis]|uniref:Uncharacterized protein n=1 Tax=Guptibacillus hwajinpoensis TaxID=208199 RepID=A0A4U1MDU7_9BACL|nr:hypothetical protein [Pseudalkalibacillus hwajinpoensis]TKD68811.1 hypothetical protein FBF83_16565 [Pseudalkalibacillus hwajinpoensis]
MKDIKRKKIGMKLIPVLILFGAFLVYLNWSQNSEPTFEINKEFNEVQSETKVFKQISQELTGSFMPIEYQLFQDVDLEKVLVKERRTLEIEKVWMQDNYLHLIYSVDLLQEDQNDKDIPQLTLNELSLHSKENSIALKVNQSSNMRSNTIPQSYVYKHKLYRGIAFNMLSSEEAHDDIQKVYEWNNVDYITLVNPEMVRDSGKGEALDSISFDTSLNPLFDQTLEAFELNKTTNLDNGLQVNWKDLMLKINHFNLSFQLEKTDEDLQGITLDTVSNGKVMSEGYYPVMKKDNYYEVSLPTFESTPETFQVQVRALDFIDHNEPLSYTISSEMINRGLALPKGDKVDIIEKLGTRNGMTISYAGVSNALPGYEEDEGQSDVLGIVIQLENIPGERFRMWFNMVTEEMQNLKYNKTESQSDSEGYYNVGPLIKISNENGELAESYGSSSETLPDKEIQAFHVKKEFFERSSEVTVKLSEFPIHEKVSGSKMTFDLR